MSFGRLVAQKLAAADSLGIGSKQWRVAVLRALPVFPLAWLAQGAELGIGGSAVVYSCSLGACEAAVKVVWVEQLMALLGEAAAYSRLECLQGQVIPQLLALGLLEGGGACFMATTIAPGSPMDKQRVTPALASAAMAALQQLHDQGFIHGDVALQNLLAYTSADGAAYVMLVDLAKARSAQPAECAAEMQRLQLRLQAVTVA
jgi:hypothetical protein